MALPINTTPIYTLVIPSTKEEIKYRPFLVKEEKALLIAQQSDDEAVMINTLKAILKDCIKSKIDIEKLAMFDVEYIFAQVRAKSVGELVDLIFKCDTCEDEKAKVKITFDLTKLEVQFPEGHQSQIELFDGVGLKMKYPDMNLLKKAKDTKADDVNQVFDVVVDCIDYIYTSEDIFHAKEQSRQELIQFIENLTSDQFAKIQAFFETMPKLRQNVDYKCPVCSKEHHKYLEGINSFF